ncbi:MAG: aminotransferase class V-fold PLP-dependent enzyme [Thermacetogeniaceae bacterium]|jgi:selenocysteine lyase/cysteine desulfurase|nr:aminotransferase class V-fold PLP-dependent enzyme [Syntrophomonadaceae bacterium]
MGEGFIYFDNAAITWPKPEQVYQAVDKTMRESCANPGRSSHQMSLKAERIVEEARQAKTVPVLTNGQTAQYCSVRQ